MDSTDTALYLQKIEELVYDHGDIITPTLLSAKWDINVNDARSLIEQYIKDTRKLKKNDLSATYMLIGMNTEGNICFEIVKETELIEKKELLKNVISELINSVQKNKDIELNALAILEPIGALCIRDKPLLGSIVSKNAVKRNIKTKLIEVKKDVQKETVKKEMIKKEMPKDIKKEEQSTSNKNNKKPGGLSNFVTKETNKSTTNPVIAPKVLAKPKNLMANFLSKQPSKPTIINQTESSVKENLKTENMDKNENKPDILIQTIQRNLLKLNSKVEENKKHKLIDTDSEEEAPISKKTKPKVQTPKQKAKKRTAKDKGSQGNKRRRIIKQDSDSDDMFESEHEKMSEDEDIIMSDEEVPPPKLVVPSKRKVRKAVSELVENDDGYFQTVNTFVYESASGEEDDEKQNNQNEENKEIQSKTIEDKVKDNGVKKKTVSPVNKTVKNGKEKTQKAAQNQKSIMSFFSKK